MVAHFTSPEARLVTVTSRSYLPGTQVMLHSFLQTNRWFCGEILVLQDDLTSTDRSCLQSSFERIAFPAIANELSQAVERLCAAQPHLSSRARRFFSLDAFHPERSGPILFCDSDMLFRGDIAGFVEIDSPLVACGDRAQIEGNARDPVTLAEASGKTGDGSFASFNAGLMAIRLRGSSTDNWNAILDQLRPEAWEKVQSSHTDQAVLNRIFGGRVSIADPAFNLLVGHIGKIREVTGIRLSEAKVLHFNNATKPWRFDQHLAATANDPATIKAFGYWFDAYAEFLTSHHLRSIATP